MYTWTSRFLLLMFTLSIFAPDYARAQAASNDFSANLRSSMTQSMADPSAAADAAARQLQQLYLEHTTEILPLFTQFEDLETPISDITKLVNDLHNTAQKFEKKQAPALKNWVTARMQENVSNGKLPFVKDELPFDSFIDQMPGASSLQTEDAFLKAVEKYGDNLDIWFLVEYLDPLYQKHYNIKTVYYAATMLSSTVFQLNQDVQNISAEERVLYEHLLTRLSARAHYRLNRIPFDMNKENSVLARGALRMLDAHVRNGLKALGSISPFPYQWNSMKAELDQYKSKKPGQSSTAYRTLLMSVEFATTYALVTGHADKLISVAELFEAKPMHKIVEGYRPTDYQKHYTEVIVQMYNTIVTCVKEGFLTAQATKSIPNVLLSLAEPQHGTDVRVHAIFTAGFLNQKNKLNLKTGEYPRNALLSIPREIRQKLTGYAADLIRLTYGTYYEDYGFNSDGMKELDDHLAQAIDFLLPVTGVKAVWIDQYQKEICDLSQKTELNYIPDYSHQYLDKYGKAHFEKACVLTSNRADVAFISLHNEKNSIAVDREQRDQGARFLFDWVLFDIGITAIGKLLTITIGAARFLPASIRVANAASKGSKMTRFFAKLNQGVKYGTRAGFTSKLAKEGFIIADMKTVKTAASTAKKTAPTAAKTAGKAAAAPTAKATAAPAVTQAQTITAAAEAGAGTTPAAAAKSATTTTNFSFFHNNGFIEGNISVPGSRWSPLTRIRTEHAAHGFVSGAPVTTQEMNMAAGNMLASIVHNPSTDLIENFTLTPEYVQGLRLPGAKTYKQVMEDYRIHSALKTTAETNPIITISDGVTLSLNADETFGTLYSLHQKRAILGAMNTDFNWQATKLGKFFPDVPPSELGAARDIALADINATIAETYDFLQPLGFQSAHMWQLPAFQRMSSITKWAAGFGIADAALYKPSQAYVENKANEDLKKAADKVGLQLPEEGQDAAEQQLTASPQDVHSALTSAEPQTFEGSSLMIPIIGIKRGWNKTFGDGNGLINDNQMALLNIAAINQRLGNARITGQANYTADQADKISAEADKVVKDVYTKYRDGLADTQLSAEQKAYQQQVLTWMGEMEQELQTISAIEDPQTKWIKTNEWVNKVIQKEADFDNNFPRDVKGTYQAAIDTFNDLEQNYVLPRAAQEKVKNARAAVKRIFRNERFSDKEKVDKITEQIEQCIADINTIVSQETGPAVSSDASDELYDDAYNSGAASMAY